MAQRPRSSRALLATGLVALLVAGSSVTTATASHFRSSGPDFTVVGDDATWTLVSAWEKDDASSFVGLNSMADVRSIAAWTDEPGSGTSTGVSLTVTSETGDESNDLYSATVEVLTGSLAALADGKYEIFVEGCCRVGDIENSAANDFSQWVRFEKLNGAYLVAPRLSSAILYAPLPLNGATTTISYAATAGSSWASVTDADFPFYGSNPMPCSTLTGSSLTVGSALCTGGDVWSDIYTEGSFWAAKVRIADAAGRDSVAETLFRVESLPEPYIDSHEFIGNGTTAEFSVIAPDTAVASWEVDCTNVADPADVKSGTSSTSPVTVARMTIGATYNCVVSATNGAGTGVSTSEYQVGPVVLEGVLLLLELEIGQLFSGETANLVGAGLDPNSPYTLTMFSDPIELYSGVTDANGEFDEDVVIPAEACIPGAHHLVLSGIEGGQPTTAEQWIEIDSSCLIRQVSYDGPVTPAPTPAPAVTAPVLAATGAGDMVGLLGLALALVVGGAWTLRRTARATAAS